jgi:hypothetical protein
MFKLEKEHKAGVISGLVATILFIYFLQPIIDWASTQIINLSRLVSSSYIDRLYMQSAHLETQNYSFWLVAFLLIAMVTPIIAFSLLRLVPKSVFSNIAEMRRTKAANNNGSSTFYSVLSSVLGIIFSIYLIVVLSGNYMQLSAITSFKQHLRIIAPYINETKNKEILSQWSLMKSEGDYIEIYKIINKIADENRIELPENAIYSAKTI